MGCRADHPPKLWTVAAEPSTMRWRVFRSAEAKVAGFTSGREPQPDAEFLRECGTVADDKTGRTAVGVRQAVARVGSVDPAYIRATDRFPEELGALPVWDSMDAIELIMELEEGFGIEISDRDADWIFGYRGLIVHELVARVHATVPARVHSTVN